MAKRNRVVSPKSKTKGNIPEPKLLQQQSTNDMTPTFSFRYVCQSFFLLEEWQPKELAALIELFKKLEQTLWKDITGYQRCGFKSGLSGFSRPLPDNIPEDVTICEFRVTQKARIFGFRVKRVFHLIWFDRNHQALPKGKNRRVG